MSKNRECMVNRALSLLKYLQLREEGGGKRRREGGGWCWGGKRLDWGDRYVKKACDYLKGAIEVDTENSMLYSLYAVMMEKLKEDVIAEGLFIYFSL